MSSTQKHEYSSSVRERRPSTEHGYTAVISWFNNFFINCHLGEGQIEYILGIFAFATKIILIYCRHNSLLLQQQTEGTDLKEIIIILWKLNQEKQYQRRLWLALTYLADAHSGEPKLTIYIF